jgi:hypothetical protein
MPLVRMGAYNTPSGGLSVQNRSRDFVERSRSRQRSRLIRKSPVPSITLEGVQDTLFELRDKLAELQAENPALKAQLVPKNAWEVESAKYGIVTTKGGATVYRTKEPPLRYTCPKCYADQKIQFLQDLRVMSGDYRCASCKVA